ncbi:MAG: hypothetical protein KKF30_00610 [Proteobacteria bacterium]|nr:hypothetical protein [Pseudomonadota bacterium]MBU4471611.1 hypothetical protein [Pseudomonadota bacterium]MCG2751093.1 hypothetical protein [Desulfobacteraceae bacterium]
MTLSEVKNHFGGQILVFSGAATCRLASQGGVTIKDKLSNGVIYSVKFDEDCKLTAWDFGCK